MTPEELEALLAKEEAAIAQLEALPDVTPTPSLMDRARLGASMMPYPFRSLAEMGIGAIESPRTLIEEGASIGGSIYGGAAGAAAGLPLSPFTMGASVPVGAVLGSALGSYADVPIQMGIDYFTGTTPQQSRVGQATEEAYFGAGVETLLRGAGGLGRLALPVARRGAALYRSLMGPGTEEAAQRLVGAELPGIMVGQETAQSAVGQAVAREQLVQAAAEKEALTQAGLPASTLTTAQLTGSEQLARTEALLQGQPLGQANVQLAETATKQLDEINAAAESLSALKDPNPKRAGEAARTLLESAREKQRTSAGALFTDEVRAITAPVKGIAKETDGVFKDIYKDTDVLEPESALDSLMTKIKEVEAQPKAEKAPTGFGRQAAKEAPKVTETTIGKLQDLRSEALELSRSAANGSRDELFADRLVDMLGKRIDAVEGTGALKAARSEWRQFKQRWYRSGDGQLSPLARLLRKQNPEDIISSVGKKSAVSDEYAKVVGGLEPNKLATEMADFVQQGTVEQKLKWLRSKRAVYADSPIASTLNQWEGILKTIKATGESAAIPGLSAQNIDTEARSLVRALGGTGREAVASGAEAGTLSAGRNIARSGLTSMLGGNTVGTLMGFSLGPITKAVRESTGRTASALAQALTDPATALKYVDDAAKYGKEEAARRATQDQIAKGLVSAVESFAPRAGAFARSSGMISNPVEYAATTPLPETEADIAAEEAQIRAAIEAERANVAPAATATPEPTPEPASTVTVGKQDISIPTGEQYAPPSLVKAVMKVESGGKQEAVSSKGARGLMQLMPATARDLGVDASKPDENVEGGSRYLAQQLNEFGSEELALAAYNWGPNNIKRAMAKVRAEGKRPTWANIKAYVKVPKETREYVDKVLSLI
jgi:soluble lytic murein transglycosylase-like protein